MVTVVAGSDTYGRVKSVAGVPIVTKFAMLHMLPLWPLASWYALGESTRETTGVPMLATHSKSTMPAIPLASLDRASVVMAYLRGVFGAFALLGFIPVLFVGIMMLTGEHLDDFAAIAFRIALGALALGIVGGGATYLFGRASARDRDLRLCCSELIRLPIDPARVQATDHDWILEASRAAAAESGARDGRATHLLQLVEARLAIGRGAETDLHERKTEELLAKLVKPE
ncbi:hypothetical protein [Aeoliella mucimassa]|uniref:Uncharacterized protein n=1 Tax=Aeoliella mucimassa TaxID=2527972 RepID=A0A518ARI6_9BACT|nr:hypothetical protein [Aeoliella mucimassa]QDU57339.1 hypothetical protein Pan181_35540 [Aeoliella mucimassa]